jgi:hypothetical protein
MKVLFIPMSLALASCNGIGTIPAPNTVADRTTLDERAAIAVELAYQAAAQLALATSAAKRENVKAADRRAYAAVKAVRAVYSAGNASSYPTAAIAAHEAVVALLLAIKG